MADDAVPVTFVARPVTHVRQPVEKHQNEPQTQDYL